MKTIKRFEAFLGTQWMAWEASDTRTIIQRGRIIHIVNKQHEGGDVTSIFDLDLIPAYSIQ